MLRDGKEYEIVFTKNYDGERVANVLNRNFGKPDHSDLHFMQQVSAVSYTHLDVYKRQVEYFYDAIKLRRAEGKPLAEIITSIQQALYSGEYKDTTGLAEVEEVNARNVQFHTGWHGSPHEFRCV